MHSRLSRIALATVTLLSLMGASAVGGALYKKLKVFVLVPPGHTLAGVTRIAILDFSVGRWEAGESGRKFADFVIGQLMEPERGITEVKTGLLGLGSQEGRTLQPGAFTNVFEVVERSRLSQVMSEQQLEVSGAVDESQAVRVGKLLGVDAIVIGTLELTSSDRPWIGERDVRQGEQTVTVQVQCVTRTVTGRFRGRVVHAESGSILAPLEGGADGKDSECQPTMGDLATPAAIGETLLQTMSGQLVNEIAPHFELQEFELDNITTKEFKELAEQAADLAEDYNVDHAYVLYSSIYDRDPYNPKVLYNLGTLNEVVGNYAQASEYYGQAAELSKEKKYREALERAQRSAAFVHALAAIGVTIAGHAFEVSEEKLAEVTAVQVEVKGKTDQRFPVFAQAGEDGEVVAQVPGGVTFTVLAEEGEWYRVKLLGGKEGFIHRDRVKIKK